MLHSSWLLDEQDVYLLSKADLVTFDFFDTLAQRGWPAHRSFLVYGYYGYLVRRFFEGIYRVLQKFLWLPDFKLSWLNFVLDTQKEFAFEYANIKPISRMIKLANDLAKKKQVWIVSNTFYNEEQLRALGQRIGLEGVNYLSSSDFGDIKSRGLKKALPFTTSYHFHFGDDLKEDARFGADFFKPFDKFMYLKEFETYISNLPIRCEIVNISLDNPDLGYWEKFGICISGPAVLDVANRLLSILHSQAFRRVICLGRDGFLLDSYLKISGLAQSCYVPYSRNLSLSPGELKKVSKYLKQEFEVDDAVIFDIGWTGKSAKRLRDMFPESRIAIALLGSWPWVKSEADFELGFARLSPRFIEFRRCPEIIELAFTAPHDSVSRFSTDKIVMSGPNSQINKKICEGAIQLFNRINEGFFYDGSIKGLLTLIRKPNSQALEMISTIEHDFYGQQIELLSSTRTEVVFWTKGMRSLRRVEGLPVWESYVLTILEWVRRVKCALRNWRPKEGNELTY